MPVSITINNIPILYPEPGDDPGWGEAATQFAQEVEKALNSLNGGGTTGGTGVAQTEVTIANNQSSAASIPILSFNPSVTLGFTVDYAIARRSNSNPSSVVQKGRLEGVYDAGSADWVMGGGGVGSGGVAFTITAAGQIKYTSTNIGATGYTGKMIVQATTLAQTVS